MDIIASSIAIISMNQRFESKPHLLQEKGVVWFAGKIFAQSEANLQRPRKFWPAKISCHTVVLLLICKKPAALLARLTVVNCMYEIKGF